MGEESQKRRYEDSDEGYGNKRHNAGSGKPLLKILVPNFIAGKLIGKGGSHINELQSTFSAKIQISSNKEFYPGTDDRIVVISADIEQIKQFTDYIIEDALEETDSEKAHVRHDMKLVVTNVSAGLVIGKGGAAIKEIQEKSSARINISKRAEGLEERVIIISGDVQQRLAACQEIIEKIAQDPTKMSLSARKYSMSNNSFSIPQSASLQNNFQTNNQNMLLHNGFPNSLTHAVGIANNGIGNNYNTSDYVPKSKAKVKFMVEMEIPDNLVGSVLGKQGQTVNEISRSCGAKLQFSPKNEFAPGTTNRILTITGGMNHIQNGYKLVDQLVAQIEQQFGGDQRMS